MTALLPSWRLALGGPNKSPKTVISYLDSVKRLEAYLAVERVPLGTPGIRALPAAELARTSPASAAKHYRNLCVYFRWLVAEEETGDNPMLRVEKPKVPEAVKPFFTGVICRLPG